MTTEKITPTPTPKPRRPRHPESKLMGLNEAIDWWIEPSEEQPLDEEQRTEIRTKALATKHADFAPRRRGKSSESWKMISLLWLRLFLEIGVRACPGALQALIEDERQHQGSDQMLLFVRKKVGGGGYKGVSVERFPGRLLKGFTALELLLSPPLLESDTGHWPYDLTWRAASQPRAPERDGNEPLGSPEYALRKWPKEGRLVRAALAKEAMPRKPGAGVRLVEPANVESDCRPYRTSLRIPDLAAKLKDRHKPLFTIADSVLENVVRQAFVQSRRGRPSAGQSSGRIPSRDGPQTRPVKPLRESI